GQVLDVLAELLVEAHGAAGAARDQTPAVPAGDRLVQVQLVLARGRRARGRLDVALLVGNRQHAAGDLDRAPAPAQRAPAAAVGLDVDAVAAHQVLGPQ